MGELTLIYNDNMQGKPSDDDKLYIRQTSQYDVKPVEWEESGSKVTIRQAISNRFFIGWFTRSSDLEVKLPSKQYEEFRLRISSGTASIESVTASQIILLVTSGKLTASNMQSQKLTTKVTSGKLVVNNSKANAVYAVVTSGSVQCIGSFNAIDSKTTSGYCEISTDIVPDSLDATMTSGKVNVTIPDNDGFTLICEKTSGSFKSDFGLTTMMNGDKNLYSYGTDTSSNRAYMVKITSGFFNLKKIPANS